MSISSNLIDFANYFPFHGVNTSTALDYLRNCIGYDTQYSNNYGIAVPIYIPKNYKINSFTFTIDVTAYSTQQNSNTQDYWQLWISKDKYETTSSTKCFSTVTSNTPHHTFSIPYYTGNSNKTRSVQVTLNNFNWADDQTYYIYLWNSYPYKKFSMWRVNNWAGIADYTYKEYTISYNSNGGSGSQLAGLKTHDVDFKLPTCTFKEPAPVSTTLTTSFNLNGGSGATKLTSTKTTTYSFNSWTLNSTTGTAYSAGSSYKTNVAATFYANWKASISTTPITLPIPSRVGYDFIGWFETSSLTGTSYAGGAPYTASGNGVLYAKWAISNRTVTYNGNGGTPEITTQTVSYGVATTLSFTTPQRVGYEFLGWSPNSSSTTPTYKTGNVISITSDTVLYAVWKPLEFTISYNLNGGTVSPSANYNETVKYDDFCIILKSTDILKPRYALKYWTTKSDGKPDDYNWTDWSGIWKFVDNNGVSNRKLVLYAVWELAPFKVTYRVDEAEFEQEQLVRNVDELLSIKYLIEKSNIYLPPYDRFDCWAYPTLNQISLDDLWKNMDLNAPNDVSPRPVTLVAKLSPRYKIVYHNGSSYNILNPIYYAKPSYHRLKVNVNKGD